MDQVTWMNTLVEGLQGKLTEALASVVRQPVTLQLGRLGMVPLSEVHQLAGTTSLSAVYIPLLGDITGDIFLFMDSFASTALADMMIGNPSGTTSVIGEFEISALKELGNITSGVIVSDLANQLQLSIMLTVPNYGNDYAAAMIDQVLAAYAEADTEAFAIHLPLSIEGHLASGFFLLLFDRASFDMIGGKLGGSNV